MKKIIFLTSSLMFLFNISVQLLDYLISFNFDAVNIHKGRPKMVVTTTSYDIITSRCEPPRKHIWRYYLSSKCDCHNFNSLADMKGGGVNMFIFLGNVIKGILQGNTRRRRVFPNKREPSSSFHIQNTRKGTALKESALTLMKHS